ncbi:MAG: twin-arginine translocation signal domain-containing protein, partial [Pedobacter sp.]
MVSRRNFIKRSGIAAAGLAIWPSLGCLTANQNVGIQLYTLRDLIPNDVKGIISKISKAGYTEVETFDYNPKTGFWGFTPAEFYKILKDNGLSATSNHFGADMLLQTGSLEDTKRFIEVANILSSKAVTIPWMDEAFRKSADDYKKHANGFNKAGELSKKAGLQLAYHNHDFEFK